jgi:hypothetical protein
MRLSRSSSQKYTWGRNGDRVHMSQALPPIPSRHNRLLQARLVTCKEELFDGRRFGSKRSGDAQYIQKVILLGVKLDLLDGGESSEVRDL